MDKKKTLTYLFFETIAKSDADKESSAIVYPKDGIVELSATNKHIEARIKEGYNLKRQNIKLDKAKVPIGSYGGKGGSRWAREELRAISTLVFELREPGTEPLAPSFTGYMEDDSSED